MALAQVVLGTPSQSTPVAIPGATGPCLFTVQGTIRIDNGGQFVQACLVVGGVTKAEFHCQQGNPPGGGGHWFPFSLTMAVPEGSTGSALFILGAAAIAAQVTELTAVVMPLPGTATAPTTTADTQPADDPTEES